MNGKELVEKYMGGFREWAKTSEGYIVPNEKLNELAIMELLQKYRRLLEKDRTIGEFLDGCPVAMLEKICADKRAAEKENTDKLALVP